MMVERAFNRAILCVAAVLLVSGAVNGAVRRVTVPPISPIYVNNGVVAPPDVPPQVDAVAFVNNSIFIYSNFLSFVLPMPYQAMDVRYWTNYGLMAGNPGFEFENQPNVSSLPTVLRRRRGANLPRESAVFHNEGEIDVTTWVLIRATNVYNPGVIFGDETARFVLRSTNKNGLMDLSQGALRVGGVISDCASNIFLDPDLRQNYAVPAAFRTNFLSGFNGALVGANVNPNTATNGTPLFLPSLIVTNAFGSNIVFFGANFALPSPNPPPFQVLQPFLVATNIQTNTIFTLRNCGTYGSFVNIDTNFVGSRSINIVFAPTNFADVTNLNVDVKFLNGGGFFTDGAVVEFQNAYFDVIQQRYETNILTFEDFGGFSLFRGRDCTLTNDTFFTLQGPNADLTGDLFYNGNFLTNRVRYTYNALSVDLGNTNSPFFTNTSSSPFLFFPSLGTSPRVSDPTNVVGYVDIQAQNLNLTQTRIRAENGINIKTRNLIGNDFSFLDAPYVSFDVRTTNTDLVISNAFPQRINRLQGTLDAWSGDWSAQVLNGSVTNFAINPTNGQLVTNVTANVETWNYHVTIIGACFTPTHPTIVHRVSLEATNIVIEDSLAVNAAFQIRGQSVTFGSNATLTLPGRSTLAFTNLISVINLTNYGIINVAEGAYFGTLPTGYSSRTRVRAYDSLINHNAINAGSISIRAFGPVENSGTVFNPAAFYATNGPITISGLDVVLSNSTDIARSDVQITADNLLISGSTINAGSTNGGRFNFYIPGALVLNATNSLGDGGPGTHNEFFVTAGVRIPQTPNILGDFMNTRIVSRASTFVQSRHIWAGEDRGPTPEGYVNNLAVGRLVLDGAGGNRFRFSGLGNGVTNAMYVDYLELLNSATNFNFAVGVDPDLIIYFADSNISPEKLDQISGGRLRWVSSFAGPQSSTNLFYPNGVVYTFNAALVRSLDIDSDNDGIRNGLDCTPIPVPDFDTTVNNCPPPTETEMAAKAGATTGSSTKSFAMAKSVVTTVKALASADVGLTISLGGSGRDVTLSWNAQAGATNTVEYSDQLGGATWQPLTNFVSGPVNARVTVRDAAESSLRVYRVRVDAGGKQ